MTPDALFDTLIPEGDVILDVLDQRAQDMPDKVYLHYGEDGVRLSYAEFKRRTDRLAAGLVALGLQPGQPVSVLTRNSPDIPLFSSDMPGAERVPLNQIFVVDIADYERIMCAVTEGKVDLADLLQRAATANQNAVDGRLVLSQHIDWKGAERPDIPVLSAAATDARRRLIANLGGNPDELLKA